MAGPNASPDSKRKAKKASKAYNQLQAELVLKNQEITALKAQIELLTKTKKRKAVPNPSKKFMQIGDIIAQGYTVENLEDGSVPEPPRKKARRQPVVVEEDEDEDAEEEPESGSDEEAPVEIQSRSGRAIRRPSRYN